MAGRLMSIGVFYERMLNKEARLQEKLDALNKFISEHPLNEDALRKHDELWNQMLEVRANIEAAKNHIDTLKEHGIELQHNDLDIPV